MARVPGVLILRLVAGLAAPSAAGSFPTRLGWAEELARIGATASTLPPAARQALTSVLRSVLSDLPPGSDAASARALLRTLAAVNAP